MSQEQVRGIRARIIVLRELGRDDEVIALAREGLAIAPDDPYLHGFLALALLPTDKLGAIGAVERAVAAAPDLEWAHRIAAVVWLGAGKPRQARHHAERSVALEPQNPDAQAVLSRVDRALGRHKGAADAADAAIRLAPNRTIGYVERACIAIKAKDWVGAEQWSRQALRIDPGDQAAKNNLAVAIGQQGRRGDALVLFAETAAERPRNSQAASNARETAGALGGTAINAGAVVCAVVAISWAGRTSPWLGLAALALSVVGLVLLSRQQFAEEVERLPPHLQDFAREQRRIRLREPGTWIGRTRRARITRLVAAGLLLLYPALLFGDDDRDPSPSSRTDDSTQQIIEDILTRTDLELQLVPTDLDAVTATVSNHGPSDAAFVQLDLTLPDGTLDAPECQTVGAGQFRCRYPDPLPVDGTGVIHLHIGRAGQGRLEGRVSTSIEHAGVPDLLPENNTVIVFV